MMVLFYDENIFQTFMLAKNTMNMLERLHQLAWNLIGEHKYFTIIRRSSCPFRERSMPFSLLN